MRDCVGTWDDIVLFVVASVLAWPRRQEDDRLARVVAVELDLRFDDVAVGRKRFGLHNDLESAQAGTQSRWQRKWGFPPTRDR